MRAVLFEEMQESHEILINTGQDLGQVCGLRVGLHTHSAQCTTDTARGVQGSKALVQLAHHGLQTRRIPIEPLLCTDAWQRPG